ncbi:MAG: hypothetical protein JJ896_03155 [Rhodothermales bacterium]|nr:hypothetical protein [Rhodothermales bacterium]MBO6778631.1 hypothetical protein [Rhodothermales bacterium]
MKLLSESALQSYLDSLSEANQAFTAVRPGPGPHRQPVHTVYGGAQLFKSDLAGKMGSVALRVLDAYAPDDAAFGDAFGIPPDLAATVHARVREKLAREPVEDFRIDYEDGFGVRPVQEERAEAARAAGEVALGLRDGTLPPFIGIRIKPLNEEYGRRSLDTLNRFFAALMEASGGKVPENIVVTLPKITHVEQVRVCSDALGRIEEMAGLAENAIGLEFMVETPTSILGTRGEATLAAWVRAAGARCTAAHFGVYDYTANLDITASEQRMGHPACDFARHVMQVSLAGTGVWLSDGATNVMPVPIHRGDQLTQAEKEENRRSVHGAWRLAFDDNMHSLRHAYYQGWDLHPAQLPARYAAVYAFFLDGYQAAARRLRAFVDKAAQASLVGDVFDDAATGQGLLNYFLRALNCGAITEEEAAETGLTLDEIRMRSFNKILAQRA